MLRSVNTLILNKYDDDDDDDVYTHYKTGIKSLEKQRYSVSYLHICRLCPVH